MKLPSEAGVMILGGATLFPQSLLPLYIFEPRYRRLLAEARRHFARAHAIDREIPELFAMNGASYLFPGEDLGKGVTSLEAAHGMLPADEDIVMLLAKAYAAAGRKEDAAPLLRTIIARAQGARADEARRLLGGELAEAD